MLVLLPHYSEGFAAGDRRTHRMLLDDGPLRLYGLLSVGAGRALAQSPSESACKNQRIDDGGGGEQKTTLNETEAATNAAASMCCPRSRARAPLAATNTE